MNTWGHLQAAEEARGRHSTVIPLRGETQRMVLWESNVGLSKSYFYGKRVRVHHHQRVTECPGKAAHVRLPQSNSWVREGWIVCANPNHCFPGNYFWSLLDLITQ